MPPATQNTIHGLQAYYTTTDFIHFTKRNISLGCGNSKDWDADNAHRGAISRFGNYYYFPYTGCNDTINSGYKAGLARQYAKNIAQGYPADQVLDFYDDFSNPSLKSHLRIVGTASMTNISDGFYTVRSSAQASNSVQSIQEFEPGYMVEGKVRHLNSSEKHSVGIGFAIDPKTGILSSMSQTADTGYHIHKVIWKGANSAYYQIDNNPPIPIPNIPIGTLPLCIFSSAMEGNAVGLEIDYVIVRKYTDYEPSVNVGLMD